MNKLQIELKKLQAAHPDWMFIDCWQELKRTKPELFSFSTLDNVADRKRALARELAEKAQADSPLIAQAKTMIKAEHARSLKEKVADVQAECPGMSFVDAWAQLKKREPEFFRYGEAISCGPGRVCRPDQSRAAPRLSRHRRTKARPC